MILSAQKDNLPESQIRGRGVFRYSASATLWLTWRPTATGAEHDRHTFLTLSRWRRDSTVYGDHLRGNRRNGSDAENEHSNSLLGY
jgi:hypothetical protein